MNKSEEFNLINNVKLNISAKKITKEEGIKNLEQFMSLWGKPSTRNWFLIPDYIKELQSQ